MLPKRVRKYNRKAGNLTPPTATPEDAAIVKALKENKITEHAEKIVKVPTFELDRNVSKIICGEYTKPNAGVAVEEYGGPYTLNVYTGECRTYFSDVLFGEVYLMSGQSNMGKKCTRFTIFPWGASSRAWVALTPCLDIRYAGQSACAHGEDLRLRGELE